MPPINMVIAAENMMQGKSDILIQLFEWAAR
jgi:hypothetical protein